jgi:hypothetical protein
LSLKTLHVPQYLRDSFLCCDYRVSGSSIPV